MRRSIMAASDNSKNPFIGMYKDIMLVSSTGLVFYLDPISVTVAFLIYYIL